jgi:multiple sugar transport system ATP-binding protein
MARVVLENVVKVFPDGFEAVKNVNLDVADREFVVLVGPSGCGKSTALRCIAGLDDVTSGTIRIDDRIVNDVAPKDRDIAMVFQSYALYPHMTAFENMAFALRRRRTPKDVIERKVRKAAAILGIEDLLDRKPAAMSGGQRQRVAVGRAIVRDPKCFLFDEPLSNLDAKLRVEMRAELKRIHMSLKSTMIYVTHDQEEAMTLGDRVMVMKQGTVQQIGAPLEVYHRPVNRFVAGFLGTPPMNFIAGRVASRDGRLWIDEGSAEIAVPDRARAALEHRIGTEVVLGVRPQALTDQERSPFARSDGLMQLKVDVIEPLGDKMDVYLSTSSRSHVIAHMDAHDGLSPGQTLPIYMDLGRVHFFEPGERGANLLTATSCASPRDR